MKIVTCIAPVNIAVIKYWGKRDEDLILPINDSISGTLSLENMFAKTTIMANPNFKENKFWLNGIEETFNNTRLKNCLKEIQQRITQSNKELASWPIHICSENNFPTAAGLASSAAGYACLVSTLASLYDIKGDISAIARVGSGSACRSIDGGWVQWHAGIKSDGSDSVAKQIAPAEHWPAMRVLVLVVNDQRKKYSSTSGMKTSVETSDFLKHRAEKIVPKRVEQMREAILKKDFDTFAALTMQDSNQFHAVCLDTFPPCVYMNDVSHAIVALIHVYNEYYRSNKVAYTFDAGPNACLYLLESEVSEVLAILNEVFPTSNVKEYIRGNMVETKSIPEKLRSLIAPLKYEIDSLKYIIYTKIGDGAQRLENPDEHLMNDSGFPKVAI